MRRDDAAGAVAGPRSPSGLPALAALITGVAGGVTLVLSRQQLGLDAMAPVAQLWTLWGVAAAGLTFSFQQWAALHPVGLGTLFHRSQSGVLAALVLLALATGIVTGATRTTLFHSDSWAWPIAAAVLPLGTALNGIGRGVLARRQRQPVLAAAIAGENVIRLAVTVLLVLVGSSAPWYALALLSGFAVVALAVEPGPAEPGRERSAHGALGASTAAGFLGYAFMFGSPILLTLAGGSPSEVAALFLVLTGVRVPFVVLQALVPQLAVGLATSADQRMAIAITRVRIAVAVLVGGSAGGAAGFWLGDLVIGTIFGIRGEIDAASYGMLASASVVAACALVATVVLVVEGRSGRIMLAWGLAACSGVVVAWLGVVGEVPTLSVWLLVAHGAVVALALAPGRTDQAGSNAGPPRAPAT